MLGSLILCLKGMGILMFQLSGFYCRVKFRVGTQPGSPRYIFHNYGVWNLEVFKNLRCSPSGIERLCPGIQGFKTSVGVGVEVDLLKLKVRT